MFRKRRRPTPGFGVPPPFQPLTAEYAPLKEEGVYPYCAMMQIAAEDQYTDYVICRGFDPRLRKFIDYESGNANKPGISVAKPYGNRVKCYYQVGQIYPAFLPIQGATNYTPPSPTAVDWRLGQNPGTASTACIGQPQALSVAITELIDHNSKYVNWMLFDSGPAFMWVELQENLYTCGSAEATILVVSADGELCDDCSYTTITASDPYAVVPGNALAEGVAPKYIPAGSRALVMRSMHSSITGSISACNWAAVTFGTADCCVAVSHTLSHTISHSPSHTRSHTPSYTPTLPPPITQSPTPSHTISHSPSHTISHSPSHTVSHTPSATPAGECAGECLWIFYSEEPEAGGVPHWELYSDTCSVEPGCVCIGQPSLEEGTYHGRVIPGECVSEGSNTPSHTASHSPSHTISRTPSQSPSHTVSRTPSHTLSHTLSCSPSRTPSHTPSHTLSRSPSYTPSYTTSHSPSHTLSHSPSHTLSHTSSHTPSYTASPSRTPSHTPSPSHTVSHSPSHTLSHTLSHTVSHTVSHSPSHTLSHTPSHTLSHTVSHSPSHTLSHTPSHTPSHTASPSHTKSRTPSRTKSRSPSHTRSRTPSHTASPSHTRSHTPSHTSSPSHTISHTASHTPSGGEGCIIGECSWIWYLDEPEAGGDPHWEVFTDTCTPLPGCMCVGEPLEPGRFHGDTKDGTCMDAEPYVAMTIRISAPNETFTLPLYSAATYNMTVYWGDGSNDEITAWDDAAKTHTYATANDYVISMVGQVGAIWFNNGGDKLKVISLGKLSGDPQVQFWSCYGCANLTSIDASFGNINPASYQDAYRDCTSLASLPAGMFSGCTGAKTLVRCFTGCTSLTSVPADLFGPSTMTTDISNLFMNCTALTTVGSGVFDDITISQAEGTFLGCTSLSSVPSGLFSGQSSCTTFQQVFNGCTALTSIPSDIFSGCTAVTNMYYAFSGCTALTTIYAAWLADMTGLLDATGMFQHCESVTAIPSGLFDNNPNITTFVDVFHGLHAITSIPSGLFDANVDVQSFRQAFYDCPLITAIPSGLFDNNTAVISLQSCFYGCSGLTSIPADILVGAVHTAITTLTQMFRNVGTGYTAAVPELWTEFSGIANHSGVFMTMTAASNYGDIPADWK